MQKQGCKEPDVQNELSVKRCIDLNADNDMHREIWLKQYA